MKKRIKMTKWGKVVFTLILMLVEVVVYHILGILGSYVNMTISVNWLLLFGWFWILVGQPLIIYMIWEC